MSRYIDADKLMLDIRLDKRPTFRGAKIPPSVKETMFAYLDSAPHIDIVRCKECDMSEVYQSDSNGVMARYCKAFTPTRMVADDDFCSYGERKE